MQETSISSSSQLEYSLRAYTDQDLPFIFNSFLKSYRQSPLNLCIPNKVYYEEYHRVLEKILSNQTTGVVIACSESDPGEIFGWLMASITENGPTLIFVYVKQAYRHLGIATNLFKYAFPQYPNNLSYCFHTTTGALWLVHVYGQPVAFMPLKGH